MGQYSLKINKPKYIRTNSGIYVYDEVEPYFLDESQKLYLNNETKIAIPEKRVISLAEKVEELCDMFYLDRGGDLDINDIYSKDEFDVAKDYFLLERKHFGVIDLKAYIKFEDKLIYIGKMDEKGN